MFNYKKNIKKREKRIFQRSSKFFVLFYFNSESLHENSARRSSERFAEFRQFSEHGKCSISSNFQCRSVKKKQEDFRRIFLLFFVFSIGQQLRKDQAHVLKPDVKSRFSTRGDAIKRLTRYHVLSKPASPVHEPTEDECRQCKTEKPPNFVSKKFSSFFLLFKSTKRSKPNRDVC